VLRMNSYRLVPSESASVEVSALITVLRETDQRLKELKKGESAASRTVAAALFCCSAHRSRCVTTRRPSKPRAECIVRLEDSGLFSPANDSPRSVRRATVGARQYAVRPRLPGNAATATRFRSRSARKRSQGET
jgi:hypothetical protein